MVDGLAGDKMPPRCGLVT